jgi:hypothetical protein
MEIAGVRRDVTVKPGDPPVMMVLPPGGTYLWMSGNLEAGQGAAPENDLITGTRELMAPIKVDVLDARDLMAAQLADLVSNMCQEHRLTPPKHGTVPHAQFMLTWLGTFEKHDWVKDWWTALAETMSACHAQAPWRAEQTYCDEITCPSCDEVNLALFGGDEDVTCLSCRTMIPPDRYLIWTRILADGVSA